MDVLVTGRRCQITDEFHDRVKEKMDSIEKLKDRIIRAEVQVTADAHKRQPDQAATVEITLVGPGPVVRAEAMAEDKAVAFDLAFDKIKTQLRRASDRRATRRGTRTQAAFADAPAPQPAPEPAADDSVHTVAGIQVQGDGPLVVREKHFDAVPMTLAQALEAMELVGHDFYLYLDADSKAPSVVYRRKAYDYGVIHLSVSS